MIEFVCKKIRQEEIVRCSFGLNKTEYDVLTYMLKENNELPVSEIAEGLNLDRTTVQKAAKTLLRKDLLEREKQGLSGGGYNFLYSAKKKEEIKKRMISRTKKWSRAVTDEIGEL